MSKRMIDSLKRQLEAAKESAAKHRLKADDLRSRSLIEVATAEKFDALAASIDQTISTLSEMVAKKEAAG